MNELQSKIVDIFYDSPDMIFGFTDISYSDFVKEYKSGLVFAVPYTHQLTLENYNEKVFHEGILGAMPRSRSAECSVGSRNGTGRHYRYISLQQDQKSI